jgi:hypothetical protein
VSITAAEQLHKELLSQRGAGTMFRHGEHFALHTVRPRTGSPAVRLPSTSLAIHRQRTSRAEVSAHAPHLLTRPCFRVLLQDPAALDSSALEALLASSYGQQMFDSGSTKGAIRSDYVDELATRQPKVYLATAGADEEYAACAIVTECLAGSDVPYLCKFAVSESAQGTGVVLYLPLHFTRIMLTI